MSFSTLLTKDNISAIAIGNFDGVHLGHKELLKRLDRHGALVVIDNNKANLTPGFERAKYSHYPCFLYDFNKVKSLSAEEFIALLKRDFKGLKKIVVGFDFRFGKNRAWDKDDLVRLFNGEVEVVDEVCIDEISVHSSAIREFIKDGDIKMANKLLGREYQVKGEIISGQGLGSKKLVPTLNFDIKNYLLPRAGVYVGRVKIAQKSFGAVVFIGNRLSTDENFSVEAHILDKNLTNAPKHAAISFISRLRDNIKFSDLDALKAQIKEDILKAKTLINAS